MNRIAKVIGVVVCILVCSVAYGMGNKGKSVKIKSQSESIAVTGALPMLVDLGADKCMPCKMMAPILEELKVTYAEKMDVVFYDVWKDSSKAREYNIRAIPTQIFLDKDGNELFRHSGYYGRDEILAKWNELGYSFKD